MKGKTKISQPIASRIVTSLLTGKSAEALSKKYKVPSAVVFGIKGALRKQGAFDKHGNKF